VKLRGGEGGRGRVVVGVCYGLLQHRRGQIPHLDAGVHTPRHKAVAQQVNIDAQYVVTMSALPSKYGDAYGGLYVPQANALVFGGREHQIQVHRVDSQVVDVMTMAPQCGLQFKIYCIYYF
jgi:hypothetical protein